MIHWDIIRIGLFQLAEEEFPPSVEIVEEVVACSPSSIREYYTGNAPSQIRETAGAQRPQTMIEI